MTHVLITGIAGFIGFHTASALVKQGMRVTGIDNLNTYYDVTLKEARLAALPKGNVTIHRMNLADRDALDALRPQLKDVTHIIHLAAQPGVRYSLDHPHDYADANLVAFLNMLELARHSEQLKHFVYASSSSVYGANTKLPFSEADPVEHPVSLYAATKRGGEMMAFSYSHLYRFPATGLRFFTVYGPWGRPDMAAWKFTRAMMEETPIQIYNHGNMRRDFTYIDDIVAGVLGAMDAPPADAGLAPHRVVNLGNHKSEALMDFLAILEEAVGTKAKIEMLPMQKGEVLDTYADITLAQDLYGFEPATRIADGLPRFVDWYRGYVHR